MSSTFRDTARGLSPPRLLQDAGQKLLYALTLPLDALDEIARQGVQARFPELAPYDALPRIGRDRQIRRGPNESGAAYVSRLLLWLDSWRTAGAGFSVLEQIAGHLSPTPTRIRIVTQGGVWYTREADGTSSISHAVPSNWDWDGSSAHWARFWLILYAPQALWPECPVWGGADTWGDGRQWGTDATGDEIATVRAIVADFKPGASRCENIIIAFDDASFSPTSARHAAGMPDGFWGSWGRSIAGVQTPTRIGTAAYLDGV